MSATTSITAAPPWARTLWVDSTHVFIETPAATLGDPPYIEKYALTEGGLGKALALMRSLHAKEQPTGGYYTMPEMRIKTKGPQVVAAESTREKARAVLKKLRLV